MENLEAYPIAIIQDRSSGVYSGGAWLAIAVADGMENGAYRIIHVLDDGPHGDDIDAMEFWHRPPDWIAVGRTPDDALAALLKKLSAPPAPGQQG